MVMIIFTEILHSDVVILTWSSSFSAEDAELAVHHGVDGIIVSNHGARQLDGVPATVSGTMRIWQHSIPITVRSGYPIRLYLCGDENELSVAFFQIDALQEVVNAVQGRCEVFMDGGIRTGSDVVKALCMGARTVFIGRPALWGLAHSVSFCQATVESRHMLRYS